MSHKNEKFFKKLHKIKKQHAFDVTKKVADKEQDIKSEMLELEEELQKTAEYVNQLLERNLQLEEAIKKLRQQLVAKEKEIGDANQAAQKAASQHSSAVASGKSLKETLEDAHNKLQLAIEGLQYYAKSQHLESGFMGDKIKDRGEKAKEVLESLGIKKGAKEKRTEEKA